MNRKISALISSKIENIIKELEHLEVIKNRDLSLIQDETITMILNKKDELLTSKKFGFQGIYELVTFIYDNVIPERKYTLIDRFHYRDVMNLVKKIHSHLEPNNSPDDNLLIAALLHDIERYIPIYAVKRLDDKNLDLLLRKKVMHPENSAKVAEFFINGFQFPPEALAKIKFLIQHHDAGIDAVSIELLSNKIVLEEVQSNHPWYSDLLTLSEADSAAFLLSNIKPFIKNARKMPYYDENLLIDLINMFYVRLHRATIRKLIDNEVCSEWINDPIVYPFILKVKLKLSNL